MTISIATAELPEIAGSISVGSKYSKISNHPMQLFVWTELDNSDPDGSPLFIHNEVVEIVFFILVNSGSNVDVSIEGSFDGTNWADLKDETGTEIAVASTGIVGLSTFPPYLRPNIDGGTSVDVDVYALVRFK